MSARVGINYLRSWIPPSFAWSTAVDVFAVRVPITARDLVEFVALGELDVHLQRTRLGAESVALLTRGATLAGNIQAAGWAVIRKHRRQRLTAVRVYCRGVFRLSGNQELLVLVATNPSPVPENWLPSAARLVARELLSEHQAKETECDRQAELKRQEGERLFGASADKEAKRIWDFAVDYFGSRPVLTGENLPPHLSPAVVFTAPASASPARIEHAAAAAIVASGWAVSRDGTYVGLAPIAMGKGRIGLVTWSPGTGAPSYPEVRWTVQRRLSRALLKPRLIQSSRSEVAEPGQPSDEGIVAPQAADEADPFDVHDNLQLDDTDFRRRVDEIRRDLTAQGFEAIAWFQPYHLWSEDTWGIYFDALKLDAFALSFLDDFRSRRIGGSQTDAARLAFGLTYAHEVFHGRVEAALSWMEINAERPRYLRYKRRVYDILRETAGWLEEALANWFAWRWYRSDANQAVFPRIGSPEQLDQVVKASLDLSPPGYSDWRLGEKASTWRSFANQLSTGRPNPCATAGGLPLESTLRDPLPYDLQLSDIPLRFVGRGVIADRLRSHPATFNVPSRRELEKALRHFHHVLDASGGKGGHQKWTGPDQRAFILPTRDPVSVGVFKTFLHHIGIDKTAYVRKVRPNL